MEKIRSIIWRRLDMPGHEYARISSNQDFYLIDGTAILVYESQFCKIDYSIKCNNLWQTLSAQAEGFIGEKAVDIKIEVEQQKYWKLNGVEVSEVKECVDIDLNFSPLTNTLPICRLNLSVGEKSKVKAAWLRFPSFHLEPLEQIYERIDEKMYHYESAGGRFKTDIEIDEAGFVLNYPSLWQIEESNLLK